MPVLKMFVDVPGCDAKDVDPEEHGQYIIDTLNEDRTHTMCDGVVHDLISAEWAEE